MLWEFAGAGSWKWGVAGSWRWVAEERPKRERIEWSGGGEGGEVRVGGEVASGRCQGCEQVQGGRSGRMLRGERSMTGSGGGLLRTSVGRDSGVAEGEEDATVGLVTETQR